jgi:hypothetical protein
LQLVGLGLFAFSIWIRVEPGFEEWIQILDIYSYYIGVYILIAVSVIVLLTSFLGCCSALMEHGVALLIVSRLILQEKTDNFCYATVYKSLKKCFMQIFPIEKKSIDKHIYT